MSVSERVVSARDDYESAFGSYQPDRMADVPPTLVVAAHK